MTEERWQRIVEQMEIGDPLKDIGCDVEELFTYCEELRARLETPEETGLNGNREHTVIESQ